MESILLSQVEFGYANKSETAMWLEYFFSSGLSTEIGEISSTSVQEKIKKLIDQEEPAKPLSDQAISLILKKEGISAARRTVTKYREKLGIQSSTKRRRKWN